MESTLDQILRWPDGPGWLVLSSGLENPANIMDDVRAAALTRISIDGGLAYVGIRESDHDDLLDAMADLGAPTGYFVNIMIEDDDTIRDLLENAGMILLTSNIDVERLRSGLMGAAMEGLASAFARGSVILAEGDAIRLFGAIVDDTTPGFEWLERSIILPNVASIGDVSFAKQLLESAAIQIAVGVGENSALVLGPEKRIETWGDGHITVVLGR